MNQDEVLLASRPLSPPSLPPLVFIHIGKTAGTSLRLVLADAFGADSCSPPFVQSHMTHADAKHFEAFDAICGHISRADQLRWFPDRRVITLLREPIDRCCSFIHYVRSLPADAAPEAADIRRMPIHDFIETEKAQHNLNNTMVRQLGGHMLDPPTDLPRLFERAQVTLRRALWVGRHQTIDADLRRLQAKLGVKLTSRRDNVTPGRPPVESEPPEVIARLHALNHYDLQLWAWAEHTLFDDDTRP